MSWLSIAGPASAVNTGGADSASKRAGSAAVEYQRVRQPIEGPGRWKGRAGLMDGEEATVASRGRPNDKGDNPSDHSDDLTRIDGIGRAIAGRLQASGIRTYTDLAGLLPEEIAELLSGVTGVSPQRIAKEDWSGQARELATRSSRDDEQLPEEGQHYESFVVRMLLGKDNDVRSTTIEHVRSGEVMRWAGWEPTQLADFIKRQAGVPPRAALGLPASKVVAHAAAPAAKAATEPGAAPGPVTIAAGALAVRPERQMLRAGEPFTVSLMLDPEQVSLPAQAGLEYRAVILAKPLHGGPRRTIGEMRGTLASGRAAIGLTSAGLPEGVYRLDAAVSLREAASTRPVGLASGRASEILQVYDG